MNKIRVIICEDYKSDRDLYEKHCRKIAADNGLPLEIKCYQNGNDLLFDLEEPEYYLYTDIILLNIHMPGPDGIEVARKAREFGYKNLIIFVTSSKDYYEPAFDVKGYNYITKGKEGNEERFEKVFLKALREADDRSHKSIVLNSCGIYRQIDLRTIKYFEVTKNVITVHYDDQKFEFVSTLNKLENQLFFQGFFRIQRAFLISLNFVKTFNYKEVTMDNGVNIPISRKYYKAFKEKMEALTGIIRES